jgi:hypothetical protein
MCGLVSTRPSIGQSPRVATTLTTRVATGPCFPHGLSAPRSFGCVLARRTLPLCGGRPRHGLMAHRPFEERDLQPIARTVGRGRGRSPNTSTWSKAPLIHATRSTRLPFSAMPRSCARVVTTDSSLTVTVTGFSRGDSRCVDGAAGCDFDVLGVAGVATTHE